MTCWKVTVLPKGPDTGLALSIRRPWQAGGMACEEPQEAQGTACGWQASDSPTEMGLRPCGHKEEHESVSVSLQCRRLTSS